MYLAFSHIFVDVRGESQFRVGALFSLPPELRDPFRISKYLSLSGLGWKLSEFGYMAYLHEDEVGNRYIFAGLYLTDCPAPTKKIAGYRPQFSKAQIENYVQRNAASESEIRKKSELELTALVHDLRHLSASIYHSAVEAETAIKSSDWRKSSEDIKTVIASQTMLRVRIDYLDFSNSVDRFVDNEEIPVYSRVDKVIRCFRAAARHKGIDIRLSGSSYRLANGPNILDIVPYTIIENAIKYSPNSLSIDVSVIDVVGAVKVSITSFGPVLLPGEEKEVFRRGFRGGNAVAFRSEGTGLGLAVASSVVNIFGGSICVRQSGAVKYYNGVPFIGTEFEFCIPGSGEDNGRRSRSRRQIRASD